MARIIGLDIEDHVIRGALIRSNFGRGEVERFIEVPVRQLPDPGKATATETTELPADLFDPLGNSDPQEIAPLALAPEDAATHEGPDRISISEDPRGVAIRELLSTLRPPPDQVYVGLDGKEASLRTLEFPAGAVKKGRLVEVLPFELDDLLPFDVTEAVVDYQPIFENEETVRVLATAVPRETVRARIVELRKLGVEPRGIPVGAAALDGLCAISPELSVGGPHLVIELEEMNTELTVIDEGVCTFARSVAFGLEEFRGPNSQRAVVALKRSIAAYRTQGGAAPTRVWLAGEAVYFEAQLFPVLHELFPETPVATLTLRQGDVAEDFSGRFARAAALAGRGLVRDKRIDVRQGEFAATHGAHELTKHWKLLLVCAAVMLLAFLFASYSRYSMLNAENERLTESLRSTTEAVFEEETDSVRRAQSLLENGREIADPLPTIDAYDVLEAITAAIPPEIEHRTRRLDIEINEEAGEGRFDLQGSLGSISERDTVAANLEAHRCFQEIDKGPTSPSRQGEGLDYRIEVTILCPEDVRSEGNDD